MANKGKVEKAVGVIYWKLDFNAANVMGRAMHMVRASSQTTTTSRGDPGRLVFA